MCEEKCEFMTVRVCDWDRLTDELQRVRGLSLRISSKDREEFIQMEEALTLGEKIDRQKHYEHLVNLEEFITTVVVFTIAFIIASGCIIGVAYWYTWLFS